VKSSSRFVLARMRPARYAADPVDPARHHLVFLQLPHLDHAPRPLIENVPLAAAYLARALHTGAVGRRLRLTRWPPAADAWDDRQLLTWLLKQRPDVIAATLYLWNIERTLALLRRLRQARPATRIVVGGPEAAAEHPFLFRAGVADAIVVGDGEPVFPAIMRALLNGGRTNYRNVAWRLKDGSYTWGANAPPHVALPDLLPPVCDPVWQPDANGFVYLETQRGCPMRCSYCVYHRHRGRLSHLSVDAALRRIAQALARGAREIRFVDPTLNAHPDFDALLDGLIRLNHPRRVELFGEIRADWITAPIARRMARAGFTGVEVGAQSGDARVLRQIRRPHAPDRLTAGIRALTAAGIRVTLDLMYGLPGQTVRGVCRDIRWARRFVHTDVQCMQTLLLPGTELRAEHRRWNLRAEARPPYAVCETEAMSRLEMRRLNDSFPRRAGSIYDDPALHFVGRRLPDLYAARTVIRIGARDTRPPRRGASAIPRRPAAPAPNATRRALVIHSADFWSDRRQLARLMHRCIRFEPHLLWQFVLVPEHEEPLDLLDYLATELKKHKPLVNDGLIGTSLHGRRVSRRIFIRLPARGNFSRSWQRAAEAVLRGHFF